MIEIKQNKFSRIFGLFRAVLLFWVKIMIFGFYCLTLPKPKFRVMKRILSVFALLALMVCAFTMRAENRTEVTLRWQPVKSSYAISPENEVFVLEVTPEEAVGAVKVESSSPNAVNARIDADYGGYVSVRCRAVAHDVTIKAYIPTANPDFVAVPAVTTPFDVVK